MNNSHIAHYFNDIGQAFEQASTNNSVRCFTFRLGEHVFAAHIVGEKMWNILTRALRHCAVNPVQSPEYTIYCFDSVSTSVDMPCPPWGATAYGVKGNVEGYNTERFHTVFQPGIDILFMLDKQERKGVYWIEDAEHIPYWEQSFPMRPFIHWWSKDNAFQLVHAAAVGTASGGVLMAGKSGSGKSTTSLTCLNSGLSYVGDDYVIADCSEKPYVYSLYGTAKLVPDNTYRFPHLQTAITNSEKLDNEKALLFVNELFPEKMSHGFPLKAIFLPRVTGEKNTYLSPATVADSLFALAPTTIMHLEGHSELAFNKMGKLARSLPSFWLELGTDLKQIPDVISQWLAKSREVEYA